MDLEPKLSLKACFLKWRQEYVFIRERRDCNHNNRILYHHNPWMKFQYRLRWYFIRCMWNALQSLSRLFESKTTRSTTFKLIHSHWDFDRKFRLWHWQSKKDLLDENFDLSSNRKKYFQMSLWKGYDWERNWNQTHTRTRPKVAFCILKFIT